MTRSSTSPCFKRRFRKPADATAAKMLRKGVEFKPSIKTKVRSWYAPPKMRKVKEGCCDLAGTKFGRLTVIGLSAHKNNQKKKLWVCRCQCGDYELRTPRAIKNPNNDNDMCHVCRHVESLKQKYSSPALRESGQTGETNPSGTKATDNASALPVLEGVKGPLPRLEP